MKRLILVGAMVVALTGVLRAEEDAEPELKTLSQRLSYAIGMQMGQSLAQLPAEFDRGVFDLALDDVLKGNEPRLSPDEMAAVFRELRAQQQVKTTAAGQRNLERGKAFLATNANKEGVTTTASGLQYEVIKEGEGEKPGPTDKVEVHYRGTTISGKEFDSSYKRGKPLTFGVNRVIKGWTEGLQLMSVGSKYKLFIPSEIAYGERGAGGDIGPNETLIFEVELLGINK